MNIKYPLAKETLNNQDINALCDWLKTYPRLTKGDLTWQVEAEWSKFIGTEYAVFNNSGSSANLLMIESLLRGQRKKKYLKKGDEIIVPALTWPTTLWPVVQLGLKPIFVASNYNDLSIDFEKAEKAVTKKTKAVKNVKKKVLIPIVLLIII